MLSENTGHRLDKVLRATLVTAIISVLFSLVEVFSPKTYVNLELADGLVALVYLLLLVVALVLGLIWVYKLHKDLPKVFSSYKISPGQALARFMIPFYNVWGIANVVSEMSNQFKKAGGSVQRSGTSLHTLLVALYIVWAGEYLLTRLYFIPVLRGTMESVPGLLLAGAGIDAILTYVLLKMVMTIRAVMTTKQAKI